MGGWLQQSLTVFAYIIHKSVFFGNNKKKGQKQAKFLKRRPSPVFLGTKAYRISQTCQAERMSVIHASCILCVSGTVSKGGPLKEPPLLIITSYHCV